MENVKIQMRHFKQFSNTVSTYRLVLPDSSIWTKIDEKCQNWKYDIFARAEQNKDPGENCDIFFRDSIRHFSWVLSDLYLLAELIYDAAAAASEHQAMNCHFQSLFSGQSCLMECHDRSGAEATFPPQDPRATPN